MPEPPHDSQPDNEGAPATESFGERMARLEAERREADEREADKRERRAQMWRAEMAERRKVVADPITTEGSCQAYPARELSLARFCRRLNVRQHTSRCE
jgi:hypothetical protein